MESQTVDSDWMQFFCKTGQLLFYYNKVTAEHRWPDRSSSYENGALIGGQPLFCVGTQTEDNGCVNGCTSVHVDGGLIQPNNVGTEVIYKNIDGSLTKSKSVKNKDGSSHADNLVVQSKFVLKEKTSGHNASDGSLLHSRNLVDEEESSKPANFKKENSSGLIDVSCGLKQQNKLKKAMVSRSVDVGDELIKVKGVGQEDNVDFCVGSKQRNSVSKKDIPEDFNLSGNLMQSHTVKRENQSKHYNFDNILSKVNNIEEENIPMENSHMVSDDILPISQETQKTVIYHEDQEIQVVHVPIAQFAVAVDTDNDVFEGCLSIDERLRIQSGQSYSASQNREQNIQNQQGVNVRQYHCNVCGKTFAHRTNLRVHKNTHSEAKPHKCNTCGKTFRQKGTLKSHEDTHSGLKPHECEICGKSFTHRRSFLRHELVHTDVKPYVCKTCGKAYRHKQSLDVHEYSHTGTKPFDCKICGKSFTNKKYLKTHEDIHASKKQYECQNCKKTFTLKQNLKIHQDTCTHSGSRLFQCKTCGKAYTRKANLKRHEETNCSNKSAATSQDNCQN